MTQICGVVLLYQRKEPVGCTGSDDTGTTELRNMESLSRQS